jgi:hypothetical protein
MLWNLGKDIAIVLRTWRKLYIAIGENHYALVCEPTSAEKGNPSTVPDLIA